MTNSREEVEAVREQLREAIKIARERDVVSLEVFLPTAALLDAHIEALERALVELKGTVQSVCEQGLVEYAGLEILGEALGESDALLPEEPKE